MEKDDESYSQNVGTEDLCPNPCPVTPLENGAEPFLGFIRLMGTKFEKKGGVSRVRSAEHLGKPPKPDPKNWYAD